MHVVVGSNPLSLLQTVAGVRVIGYRYPALKGVNVSFNCQHGLVLAGPKSATCTYHGNWEPDPRDVECQLEGN